MYSKKDRFGITQPLKTYHSYTSGSGRFTSNQDHTGNDAPRGSATGNWIKILTNIEHYASNEPLLRLITAL